MSDDKPLDETPDEPVEACCDLLQSCCAELDSEDLALLSLGTGLAACAFATFGLMTWTHFLALPCGVLAIGCGYKALKDKTPREHAALCGVGTGALGLAMWLVTNAWRHVLAMFGG